MMYVKNTVECKSVKILSKIIEAPTVEASNVTFKDGISIITYSSNWHLSLRRWTKTSLDWNTWRRQMLV